jgi:hypothetical protein
MWMARTSNTCSARKSNEKKPGRWTGVSRVIPRCAIAHPRARFLGQPGIPASRRRCRSMDRSMLRIAPERREEMRAARRANHLLIYGSHAKPQHKIYFAFTEPKSVAYLWPSRPTERGVGHRHNVGRVAVDADVAKTSATKAYGKSVWSRRRDAGVYALGGIRLPRAQRRQKSRSPGRARHKP